MREIKDVKEEPPPPSDGEKVYVKLEDGWIAIYTAKDGKWSAPYRCYPATMG